MKIIKSRNRTNSKANGLFELVIKLMPLSIAVVPMTSAFADQMKNLEESWYVGGAMGIGMLDPSTPEGASVTSDKGFSSKIYAGVDISNHIGIEAFWTSLGSAQVEGSAGDGDIKYSAMGVNGIYRLPVYVGKIHPFGKLGIAKISTKADEAVHVNQENDFSVFGGVGADYDVTKHLKLRAEYDYYTKDMSQFNIGLNWSPNKPMYHSSTQVAKPIPVALPITYIAPKPKPIVRQRPAPKPVIQRAPPPRVKKVVQYLNASLSGESTFASGSSVLMESGRSELDHLISLTNKPGFKLFHITISGHTDNIGSRLSNIKLSKRRAESVAQYLDQKGIQRKNMSVVGYGDSQPIASNGSGYGRSKNRRVEVKIRGERSVVIAVQ